MPDPIPACFRGGATSPPPSSTSSSCPNLTTSIYETHLGLAFLSWSRTLLGLSLTTHLCIPSSPSGEPDSPHPFLFKIRPSLLWKKKGSRRFQIKKHPHLTVDFSWDLTRARFSSPGCPEPSDGFSMSISINGQILLSAGDATDRKKSVLISRREHVVLGDSSYKRIVRFGGKDREISIDLGDVGMWIGVDGIRVVEIRRIRWKFRGSERVDVVDNNCGGSHIHVSWDLHDWLFSEEIGNGVFVFRFEGGEEEEEGCFGNNKGKGMIGGYFGSNWSEKSLLKKTSSSSSSGSTSSSVSSTVMEWASQEEEQLRNAEGFSLLVYAWKR